MSINTNEVLKKHNIRLTKTLGQNFLTDVNVLKNIVSAGDVGKEDLVLEIGPGIGALTIQLVRHAGMVLAVEIDRHLIPALNETLQSYDNVQIINEDIMKLDIKERIKGWKGPKKAIANLPYYITTPIIMSFLEDNAGFSTLVFMVQKEVAQRMAALPGGKAYGALSVGVQFYAEARMCFTVSRNCFIPKPDVDSSVICLKFREDPPVSITDKAFFFKIVKASFSQRRKTLVNSLGNSGISSLNKDDIKSILTLLSISQDIRAEMLSITQFADIANLAYDRINN